jgi:hypothetical protein
MSIEWHSAPSRVQISSHFSRGKHNAVVSFVKVVENPLHQSLVPSAKMVSVVLPYVPHFVQQALSEIIEFAWC